MDLYLFINNFLLLEGSISGYSNKILAVSNTCLGVSTLIVYIYVEGLYII